MDKSTIDWDVDYFERFLEHHPSTDPGMGVFQKCDGMFDVPVVGVHIVSIKKKKNLIVYKNVITWRVGMTRSSLSVQHYSPY